MGLSLLREDCVVDIDSSFTHRGVAVECKSYEEETFKDIIADAVGLMLIDANPDIAAVGFNLVVIFMALNPNWSHLEPEASRRFQKYFVGAPKAAAVESVTESKESEGRDANGSVDRRIIAFSSNKKRETNNHVWTIPQMSDINISAPTMPDI